jgi:alpha-tubulin suppressor-like RCC1 family protein
MGSNPTGFKITDTAAGWSGADFEDVFVRKDCFLEGGLWVWGLGSSGQMGNNSTITRSSPVQTISGGTNWKSLADSNFLHVGAIKTDGTLWTWGQNNCGQMGDNTRTSRSSPVQTISGGTNWKSVSSSFLSTAAIKTDGTLWLWGSGFAGRLGSNSTIYRSSPVQTISGGTNWKSVSISGGGPYAAGLAHTAAIKTDGTLWLWGSGGGIGNNSDPTVNRSSPVQTISGGTNWKSVSVGFQVTAAIKTDGTLWLWGNGGFTVLGGQLGDNTSINRSSPVQTISGGTNWRSVSTTGTTTAAIKTDGTLWVWGRADHGGLGINSTIAQSSPVQTISGGTNWRIARAAGGLSTAAAIKTDGTLWLWGSGFFGNLGNNTNSSYRSSPVQTISGGTNWRSVVTGYSCTVTAIREDCW